MPVAARRPGIVVFHHLKRFARRCRDWWHSPSPATAPPPFGLDDVRRELAPVERAVEAVRTELETARDELRRLATPPDPPAPTVSPELFRQLERQGLFIFGCARSGTTALLNAFNTSPDVYMLSEGFLYRQGDRPDFHAFHWGKHRANDLAKGKGLYPPLVRPGGASGFELLSHLSERYRFVGDKVAFGPWILDYSDDELDLFLRFHATHFFHSQYVVIVRHPAESVTSMSRLFAGRDEKQYLATYALCLRVGLELYATFPNVRLISLDRLNADAAVRLARRIGFELERPPVWLDPRTQPSASARGAAVVSPEAEPMLHELAVLYDDVTAQFDAETFRHAGPVEPMDFSQDVFERTGAVLRKLGYPPRAEPG